MAFSPTFDELRDEIDGRLRRFLDERSSVLPEAEPLIEEIRRTLSSGGKRIRPLFCYWGFRAAGGNDPRIVTSAAALELLHTFAIVHDDIMDAADERRGQPTVSRHKGLEVALLVGDLALVLADEAFMSAGFPAAVAARGFAVYSRMRQEVSAGQYLDYSSATSVVTEQTARRVAVLKSGNYSVEEPLLIGATLAGAEPEVLEQLSRFGRPLGEAFQLRDDLLGTFGDRSVVGKPVDSDVREGKRHVLYAKTVARLEGDDLRFFLDRWGAGERLTAPEVDRLRELVESSGGKAATEELLDRLTAEASDALAPLASDPESHSALDALLQVAVGRDR